MGNSSIQVAHTLLWSSVHVWEWRFDLQLWPCFIRNVTRFTTGFCGNHIHTQTTNAAHIVVVPQWIPTPQWMVFSLKASKFFRIPNSLHQSTACISHCLSRKMVNSSMAFVLKFLRHAVRKECANGISGKHPLLEPKQLMQGRPYSLLSPNLLENDQKNW